MPFSFIEYTNILSVNKSSKISFEKFQDKLMNFQLLKNQFIVPYIILFLSSKFYIDESNGTINIKYFTYPRAGRYNSIQKVYNKTF